MPCLATFLLRLHVPFFQISYYRAIILVSSSSCIILAVLMREVSCVGYIPRTWDPRSLQPILDGPLYFEAKWLTVEALLSVLTFGSIMKQNNYKRSM